MGTDAVSDRVRELADHLDVAESEVIQQAIETGVDTLYRDMVVDQYLAGELPRETAVELLGPEVVNDVDTARDAVEEDVEWGLSV